MSTPEDDAPPAWVIAVLQDWPIDRLQMRERDRYLLIDPVDPPAEPTRPADPVDFQRYQADQLAAIAKRLAIPAEYFTAADSADAAANPAK